MSERQEVWEAHLDTWAMCLRCPLAEWRGRFDPDRNKAATLVPPGIVPDHPDGEALPRRRVVFMLSFPDADQENESSLYGTSGSSPSFRALKMVLDSLGDRVPFRLEDTGIISALGCRPADFNASRKNRQVTVSMISPCLPRWQTELMLLDPDLLVTLGHGAFAAVSPKTPKISAYHANLGEGRRLILRGPYGTELPYDVYVAPDVLRAAEQGTIPQWGREFDFMAPLRPSQEPVDFLRWHIYRALCIADHIGRRREGLPPSDEWEKMLEAQRAFHESRYSVQESLEEQAAWAGDVSLRETSMNNVRRALLFGDVDDTEPVLSDEDDAEMDEHNEDEDDEADDEETP